MPDIPDMPAESAYLFRHALLRDAAYQLQMPSARARLHGLAFELIEQLFGGRAPEPPALSARDEPKLDSHPTDVVVEELIYHASQALDAEVPHSGRVTDDLLRQYRIRGAIHFSAKFRPAAAMECWLAVARMTDGPTRGLALHRAASTALNLGRLAEAAGLVDEVLDLARDAGDRDLTGLALATRGNVLRLRDGAEAAISEYLQSLELLRAAGMHGAEGSVLQNLANVYSDTGRFQESRQAYERALEIACEIGDRRLTGIVTGNLSILAQNMDDFERAEELSRRALDNHRGRGDSRFEGRELRNLADIYFGTRRYEDAQEVYLESLRLARQCGDRGYEGIVLGNLGVLYREIGRLQQAEQACLAALAIHKEVGNRRSEAFVNGSLACIYLKTGRAERAQQALERCMGLHRLVGNQRFAAEHLCDYALALLAANRPEHARHCWAQGETLLTDLSDIEGLNHWRASMREACTKAGVQPFDEDEIAGVAGSVET